MIPTAMHSSTPTSALRRWANVDCSPRAVDEGRIARTFVGSRVLVTASASLALDESLIRALLRLPLLAVYYVHRTGTALSPAVTQDRRLCVVHDLAAAAAAAGEPIDIALCHSTVAAESVAATVAPRRFTAIVAPLAETETAKTSATAADLIVKVPDTVGPALRTPYLGWTPAGAPAASAKVTATSLPADVVANLVLTHVAYNGTAPNIEGSATPVVCATGGVATAAAMATALGVPAAAVQQLVLTYNRRQKADDSDSITTRAVLESPLYELADRVHFPVDLGGACWRTYVEAATAPAVGGLRARL
ncbi:hypothetical protein H9P43_006498 [Blastocladiella emersonii ATCC 22665]|nr:hypothetical protein H9P43_006498 [Blastocladiella emersonii ATCC 22665]